MIEEIQRWNYLEHFKAREDLAKVYPLNHPKRIAVEKAIKDIAKALAPKDTLNSK